ncbi:RNA 2',3'-cyclic phosphodiesterase [Vulcanisaeta thermophila]|uniref:RNA 2',3'-cyclic phosphodiesterase n=1 Tax=Vulcanisaeta thermophila TaxID=867917 RepID=UPI000852E5B4|nr:RNA 2',3'-cyclic phosphodiesterase [Vulcanisaeta thermophila]
MPQLYRVFIAVDINDELKKPMLQLQRELMIAGVDMKPVEPENLHITLRFIGEITREELNEVMKRLERLSYRRFIMHMVGVGAFPDLTRPRVIWVGVKEGSEDLARVHDEVMKLTGDIGQRDDREFTPHLTIARVRHIRDRERFMSVIRKYENQDFGTQEVIEIKLKQSTLTPRGPIYNDLMKIKLT